MTSLFRTGGAGLFFMIVLGALVGSSCDLAIPYGDLASLERMPEASLAMPGADLLNIRTADHRLGVDGPSPASLERSFGTNESAAAVVSFHERALAERGWVGVPGVRDAGDATAPAWCYGDAEMELHLGDPATARDHSYATTYQTRLVTADNRTWRALGRPCPDPFPPPLRDARATEIIAAAIAVFFIAAQITRQRARTVRGPAEVRAAGFAGVSAYFLWVPYLVVWQRYGPAIPLPEVVRWSALALVVGGTALALWAMFTLGRHYDLELELHRGHELVRRGPFAWVRHPIYTGLALHFIGACLATGNVVLVAGTILVSFPAFYARARSEERLLRERFGDAYDAYAREVPMLVPGLR